MDSITAGIGEVIRTLDAARSNSRALDLALAAQDAGIDEVIISAKPTADANPTVRYTSEKPLELNDSDKAQKVTDIAKDIEFLADLYAAGQSIENFMRVEQSEGLTHYIIDFGKNLPLYTATLRSVLTSQLNTALGSQLSETLMQASGVAAAPAPAQSPAPESAAEITPPDRGSLMF